MGTGAVEVKIAVIWMGKLIGGELVVVPDESVSEVVSPCGGIRFGIIGIENEAVEIVDEEVYAHILSDGAPRMLTVVLRKGVGKEAVAR